MYIAEVSLKSTVSELKNLDADKKLEIISELWDSISPGELPVPEAHKLYLEKQLADEKAGKDANLTLDELKERYSTLKDAHSKGTAT